MKTLHLSLKKQPFDVMVTGEKKNEYRKPSTWIKSRLYGKSYDTIKFVNGYGSDKPFFICKYVNFYRRTSDIIKSFSNGLTVNVEDGDFVIVCGEILETGNLTPTKQ